VHVFMCMGGRKNTERVLSRLSRSVLPDMMVAEVHICMSQSRNYEQIEPLMKRLTNERPKIQFRAYRTANKHACMDRYHIARQVYQRTAMDYFVIVDDDQLVRENTLAQVWSQRRPRVFRSWWGKAWYDSERLEGLTKSLSRSLLVNRGSVGPQFLFASPTLIVSGKSADFPFHLAENPTPFHTGGPGMSITDASLLDVGSMFETSMYDYADDLWVSFAVKSLGWRIEQLSVVFDRDIIASEAGLFRKKWVATLKQNIFEVMLPCLRMS
jgi:hypothetical protein